MDWCKNKQPLVLQAPGKINLMLHLKGRRYDGFHFLESLVIFTDFSDTIEVFPCIEEKISLLGSFIDALPHKEENIIWQAYQNIKNYSFSRSVFPISFLLKKKIPVLAGMGGGSTNAAATLKAIDSLWKLDQKKHCLKKIASSLGADVPMCLVGKPLVASGIGEVIVPIEKFPKLHLVLVNSGEKILTKDVFGLLKNVEHLPSVDLAHSFTFDSLIAWLKICRNDLLGAACLFSPSIPNIIAALRFYGAAFSGMSGSGATCFGIFPKKEAAKKAAFHIKKSMPDSFVVVTKTNHTV